MAKGLNQEQNAYARALLAELVQREKDRGVGNAQEAVGQIVGLDQSRVSILAAPHATAGTTFNVLKLAAEALGKQAEASRVLNIDVPHAEPISDVPSRYDTLERLFREHPDDFSLADVSELRAHFFKGSQEPTEGEWYELRDAGRRRRNSEKQRGFAIPKGAAHIVHDDEEDEEKRREALRAAVKKRRK